MVTGYVRGEYFIGEWRDGSPMEGYAMYTVIDGEISTYGRFSPTGKIEDAVDAGDLLMSRYEASFERVEED